MPPHERSALEQLERRDQVRLSRARLHLRSRRGSNGSAALEADSFWLGAVLGVIVAVNSPVAGRILIGVVLAVRAYRWWRSR